MNNSYYGIALDIKSVQSQVTFPVKQGDTSRGIKIILTDGGKAYLIERNCSATFKGEKSDGKKINNICTIENNRIVYHITEQTVASPGIVDCEVSLFDPNGNLITTPRFTLIVDSRVGGDEYESTDEYNALEHYLSEVEKAELERQANEEARKTAIATVIDENSTHDQYASAQATYEYGQKVKNELIESVDTELDENSTNPVQNKAIVEFISAFGESLEEELKKYERVAYKSDEIYDDTSGYASYPTTKAVFDYSETKANKLSEYKEDATDEQYYSAKAVNELLNGVGELFEIASEENDEKFASKDYVNELMGGIENGSY